MYKPLHLCILGLGIVMLISVNSLLAGSFTSAENQKIAEKYIKEGNYNKALDFISIAIKQYNSESNKAQLVHCTYLKARIYFLLKEYPKLELILDTLDKIAAIDKKFQNIFYEGKLLRGRMIFDLNKIDQANTYFEGLLPAFQKIELPDSTKAVFYCKKGLLDYYKGDFYEAVDFLKISIGYGKKVYGENSIFISDQINNLGVFYFSLGDYSESLKYYHQSAEILKSFKKCDSTALASTYINIAMVFSKKEDSYNALQFYQKAEKIFLGMPNNKETAIVNDYINIASEYYVLGQYDKQFEAIQNALKYSGEKNRTLFPRIYNQLAMCYEMKGDLTKAFQNFKKSEEISREIFGDSPDLAYANSNIGEFCLRNKIYLNQTFKYFKYSYDFFYSKVKLAHPNTARSLYHIGTYYRLNGEYQKALEYYHKGLLAVTPNFNNTDIYTFPYHTETLSTELSILILNEKAIVLNNLAEKSTEEKFKKAYLISSFQHYKQCLKFLNEMNADFNCEESRFSFLQKELNIYYRALECAYKLYSISNSLYYLDNAFVIADNLHAASLQLMLREKNASSPVTNIPDLKDETELKKLLGSYRTLIDKENSRLKPNGEKLKIWTEKVEELTLKLTQIRLKISIEHPAYRYLGVGENSPVSVIEVQKKLSETEALLEYVLGDSSILSFCITKHKVMALMDTISDKFYQRINDVNSFVKSQTFTSNDSSRIKNYQKSAFSLYNQLLKPFITLIQNKSLIIVPDQDLTYLPFSVLLTSDISNKNINFKKYPYFLYQNPIRYILASGLLNDKPDKILTAKFACFAPDYTGYKNTDNSDNWQKLNYNVEEVQKVSDLYRGDLFIRKKATKENFIKELDKVNCLHLALHASTNDNNPQNSKLIFTSSVSSSEENYMFAHEAYNFRMNADMLVLSGCNTGSGTYRKGEGILSLTRGFFFAGVKSIVMTMWTVDDKSGLKLTEGFYRNLKLKKHKDEALQRSKIEFIAKSDVMHAHPYFWAGYMVIGANNPILPETNSKPGLFSIALGILTLVVLLLVVYFRRKYFTKILYGLNLHLFSRVFGRYRK